MDKITQESQALRISSMLLLKNGEISSLDIKALPFLNNDFDVQIVIEALLRLYDVELISKKHSSGSLLNWEEIVRLRNVPAELSSVI